MLEFKTGDLFIIASYQILVFYGEVEVVVSSAA